MEVSIGASMSHAESILLAQFYHSRSQPDTANEIFNFSYEAGASVENNARLDAFPTMADVGRTFAADPATVEDFQEVFTSSGTIDIVSSFGISGMFMEFIAQEFFTGPFMGEFPSMPTLETNNVVMKAFIPQLGPNFSGYHITGVEQTIEGLSVRERFPGEFVYWGAQTIRIFGEQIPEPASWLVATSCLPILCYCRSRKSSLA
jgi:hypothetical protein